MFRFKSKKFVLFVVADLLVFIIVATQIKIDSGKEFVCSPDNTNTRYSFLLREKKDFDHSALEPEEALNFKGPQIQCVGGYVDANLYLL